MEELGEITGIQFAVGPLATGDWTNMGAVTRGFTWWAAWAPDISMPEVSAKDATMAKVRDIDVIHFYSVG